MSDEGFIFDQEILDAFVNEARDHLRQAEQDLLQLENQTEAPDKKLIDRVFRAIHSIKGSAGFMQFENITRVSHQAEALLQKIRTGEIKPESECIDAILAACDLLNKMTDNIRESENTDIREISDRLSGVLTPEKESSPIPEPEEVQEDSSSSEDNVFDEEMVSIFVAETKEHLQNIEVDFLILENQGTRPDQGLIDKVFRSIHSIKGSAGMLRLEKISKLAHTMEALLQKMRDGEIYPESEYIEALLRGADLLNQMTKNIKESENTDIQEVHQRLSELLKWRGERRERQEERGEKGEARDERREAQKPVSEEPVVKKQAPRAEKQAPRAEKQAPRAEEQAPRAEEQSPRAKPSDLRPQTSDPSSETVRIKVDLLNLLMTLAGELVLVRNQSLLKTDNLNPEERALSQRMDMVTTQLQEAIMRTRMQPVGNLFAKLPRIVRDISRRINKQIRIETMGDEVELDKTILESLSDPLTHIIRNACDHGIETPEQRVKAGKSETGTVTVRAYHEAGQINIVIQDDGRGISPNEIKQKAAEKEIKTKEELDQMSEREILSLIMLPGFSTSEKTTEISGRGVGMDVVKASVEQQGGAVEMLSEKGEGTTIHLRLPLTLAIIPCLIAYIGEDRYAIPKVSVDELLCLYDEEVFAGIEYAGIQEVCRLRNTLLPVVRMNEVLARPLKFTEQTRSAITEKYSRLAKRALSKFVPDNARKPVFVSEQGKELVTERTHEKIRENLLIVVVKLGHQRFGLTLDRVTGSEEIVVNPIHPKLKSLNIYSGTTIMGDGSVALILDIHGIAEHAGVEFVSEPEKAMKKGFASDASDIQRLMIFENGEHERFAVPLALIRRVQEIRANNIESVGTREYITIDDVSTRVLRLDQLLNVSPCKENKELYLLLPRHTSRSFGILMSRVIDVIAAPLILNEDSYSADGILGTAILMDRMTLFPDIYRLFERAEPPPETFRGAGKSKASVHKILLVEDALFFRRLVKGYLSALYEVKTAENGREALELMEKNDFDLIVSDIEMPVMDGWTFIKHIRSLKRFKNTPIIALTTLDTPEDQARMRRVGFDAYQKKIDRERLIETVEKLLMTEKV